MKAQSFQIRDVSLARTHCAVPASGGDAKQLDDYHNKELGFTYYVRVGRLRLVAQT